MYLEDYRFRVKLDAGTNPSASQSVALYLVVNSSGLSLLDAHQHTQPLALIVADAQALGFDLMDIFEMDRIFNQGLVNYRSRIAARQQREEQMLVVLRKYGPGVTWEAYRPL